MVEDHKYYTISTYLRYDVCKLKIRLKISIWYKVIIKHQKFYLSVTYCLFTYKNLKIIDFNKSFLRYDVYTSKLK